MSMPLSAWSFWIRIIEWQEITQILRSAQNLRIPKAIYLYVKRDLIHVEWLKSTHNLSNL